MSDKPKGTNDLYRKAIGARGVNELVEWIFLEAKAKGRLAVADRRLRELESIASVLHMRAWNYGDIDSARQLLMQHAPDEITVYKAETAVSDATEEVSACARMIELLHRQTRNEGATSGKPNEDQPRNGNPQGRQASHGQDARGVRSGPNPLPAKPGGPSGSGGVRTPPAPGRAAGG